MAHHDVSDATFEAEVLKSDLLVMVDFWAPWCGPCKAVAPAIEQLGAEMDGQVKIVKMNVDENMEVPGRYGIMSIPTFIIFKGGQPVRTWVGARTKEDMQQEITQAMAA